MKGLRIRMKPARLVEAGRMLPLALALLLPIIPSCKKRAEPSTDLLEESGLDANAWRGVEFYEGAGCPECNHTGFRGRTAIGELLALSDRIREMILDKRPSSEIRRAARQEGMITLREAALEKARQGVTTLRESNKVTFVE